MMLIGCASAAPHLVQTGEGATLVVAGPGTEETLTVSRIKDGKY